MDFLAALGFILSLGMILALAISETLEAITAALRHFKRRKMNSRAKKEGIVQPRGYKWPLR